MKKALYRSKNSGQSIPLIAIMLVVLFGMAALSLDVGSTYAKQREVVRATNVSAIEGMNKVIEGEADRVIYDQIVNSLKSNGINVGLPGQVQVGQVSMEALYLDAAGSNFLGCNIGSCGSSLDEEAIRRVSYIRVSVDGRVQTYFARLVGTNDLPVNWVANATRGICPNGIYPVGIYKEHIDYTNRRFNEPDAIWRDETTWPDTSFTQKRIWLSENVPNGNFGFLKWVFEANGGGNAASELGAAFQGAGTLGSGFAEAPWPTDSHGQINTQVQPPDPAGSYPLLPGILSVGDWVAGAPGNMLNSNQVTTPIDQHINVRTIMTLPIYDEVSDGPGGGGQNAAYHIMDTKRFLVLGYGTEQGKPYIDLVYISNGGECAQLTTGSGVAPKLTLEGQVSLYPHFVVDNDPEDLPIQYVVVLDVSGSMSWNFAGEGTSGGQVVLCQGGETQCPARSPHPDEGARRIKISHDVLMGFVDSVRPQDQVRIVTYSSNYGAYPWSGSGGPPSNDEALFGLSNVYPGSWTNDKATLRAAIDDAARGIASDYVTEGETPSAVGLARALDLYEHSPSRDPLTNKRYRRAVIFLTDGVANVTRNGLLNIGCGPENVACHDQPFEDDPDTLAPIPAMNKEAADLRALITPSGGDIYVIALGQTSLSALAQVGGRIPFRADSPSVLEDTINAIRQEVTNGPCVDGVSYTARTENVQPSNLPDYSKVFGGVPLSTYITDPEVGVVTLTNSSGGKLSGKIVMDSGRLFYRITDIPPGSYTLSYWMAFRAEDGETLIYDHALPVNNTGTVAQKEQPVNLGASSDNVGAVPMPLTLDLDPTYLVCENQP